MLIEFSEFIPLPAPEVYAYFQTPADWGRLYGFAGQVTDRGGGWYAVPLKRFPFPLVAKVTDDEPPRLVRWQFKGFWRGRGEVHLSDRAGGVQIDGYEEISIRWLPGISWLLERLFMEREFRRIWSLGWRRLRNPDQLPPITPRTPARMSLSILSSLPPDRGECHSSSMIEEPLAGWRQIQLVCGDGITGLRVIVALYDPAGRPGMVSDLVAATGGQRQESVQARVEPDGRMQGTHWLVEDDHHTPRPMTEAELAALRVLAQALWERCAGKGAT